MPDVALDRTVGGMPRTDVQEIRVLTASFRPAQATVFHTHRFPVTAYILEGEFTLEIEGGQTVVARAGESLVEPPNVRVTGYNRSKTETTRVVIFYVSTINTPFLDVVGH